MGPSERFDYIVSIFSEGSLRRFSEYLDVDISMMTIHSAKGSSGTLFSFRALRVLIGLEGFALVAKMLVYAYVLREVARLLMRRKCQMGLLRK